MTITLRSVVFSRRALLIALIGAAPLIGDPMTGVAQTVQGVVIDQSTRRPLGGARLDLLSDSGIAVAKTVADSSTGMFYLTPPAGGHYSVQIVVGRGGLFNSEPFQLDSGQTIERTFAVPPLPQSMLNAYLSADVSRAALLQPRQRMPRYPDRLRARGVGGVVRALVVVDSTGRPDMTTFRLLETDDPAFADAVRAVLEDWRYFPAELDGHPVPQVTPVLAEFELGDAPQRLRPGELGIIIRALGVVRERPAPSREP